MQFLFFKIQLFIYLNIFLYVSPPRVIDMDKYEIDEKLIRSYEYLSITIPKINISVVLTLTFP